MGCWSGTTPEQQASAKPWVITALKTGIRHLDTANNYYTEKPLGDAVRESGVPREDVFVTTKLPCVIISGKSHFVVPHVALSRQHHHAKVAESLEESLNNFGFDYIDLVRFIYV